MPVKPPILRPGDTIGIVTLGSPLEPLTIDAGIRSLESVGFRVVVGDHAYDSDGFLAGTDRQRAADLMAMFQNPEVRMIMPTRGGVGVAGILPYLDFRVIRANPKIVSGYSDITILLNVLTQYADLATFHSLLLINFRPTTPPYNFNQFYTVTSTLRSPLPIANPPGVPLIGRGGGSVTGPIVGGNLTSFVDCLGTPYEIDTTGKILLIEDTHEPVNTIYRYLNHLKLSGKLDDCIGIVMGECTGCQTAYGKTYEDLINEMIVPLGKPLLTNLTTGHGVYQAAIPLGIPATLNADAGTLTLLEPAVSPV